MLQLVDPHTPLESLIQTALEYRPEMGARTAAIAASETRYRQERARPFLPTLVVGYSAGGFGGGSQITSTTSASFNSRVDIDVMAFWTLQNLGFGNLALKRQRLAEVKEAEANRLITLNQIRDEVATASADQAARRREVANRAWEIEAGPGRVSPRSRARARTRGPAHRSPQQRPAAGLRAPGVRPGAHTVQPQAQLAALCVPRTTAKRGAAAKQWRKLRTSG